MKSGMTRWNLRPRSRSPSRRWRAPGSCGRLGHLFVEEAEDDPARVLVVDLDVEEDVICHETIMADSAGRPASGHLVSAAEAGSARPARSDPRPGGVAWPGIAGRYGRSELAGGDVGEVDPGHHVGDGGVVALAGRAADEPQRDAGVGVDGDRLLVDRPRGSLGVGLRVSMNPNSPEPAVRVSVGWPSAVPWVTVMPGSADTRRSTPARTWGLPEPATSASSQSSQT